jgi:hypothetical protein
MQPHTRYNFVPEVVGFDRLGRITGFTIASRIYTTHYGNATDDRTAGKDGSQNGRQPGKGGRKS